MMFAKANLFTQGLQRAQLIRWVFACIVLSWIFRYANHALLHQLQQPVIFKSEGDPVYWLFNIMGCRQWLLQNQVVAICFDAALLLTATVSLIFPNQRISIVLFSALYPFYFLGYNESVTHHTNTMQGILLIGFAFWFVKEQTVALAWEALRYFTLFIYVAAFAWKILVGGSVFNGDQAVAMVQSNLATYLFQHPGNAYSNLLYWLLQHPLLLQTGFLVCVAMQGSMVIGFFTKRYDRYLFWLPIVFHLVTYLLVEVCFFELLVLNFTFIPLQLTNRSSTPQSEAAQLVT